MELEPEIKVPGLECNRSLPEGFPFVNNMVIEEHEYGIFFTDIFGDQAFQRWDNIHKLRKLIADHPNQEKLKSKKVKLEGLGYHTGRSLKNHYERCSAVLLNKLPSKEKDPGSFTIPCDIGQLHIDNALADLGASISLMPYTVYKKLGLGEPKATRMSLKLVDSGGDEVIFDVDQSIKRPTTKDDECYGIDDLDGTINEEAQELLANEEPDSFLSWGLEKSIDQSDLESCGSSSINENNCSDSENSIRRIDSTNTPYPVTQGTTKRNDVKSKHLYSANANEIDEKKPEQKNLPQHLEYAYLHGDKSFPIIILFELSEKEKISLLQVLEKRKRAIAWKMSDIKGISPSYCTHKILMEDDYKPVIQPQRRLNPKVQDVVKNKIVKLLDSGLIYPILDSSWVSPIHVVPKKGGMTVVLNDNNELIPSRTVTG
ncbi:DNA-directed DNA polymerase [Tanacetum coccineum]